LKEAEKTNNTGVQNKSVHYESAPLNNHSTFKTPTYPNNSEKDNKITEKKFTYKFLERNLLDSFNNEEELYYELYDSDLIDFHETLVNPKNKEMTRNHHSNSFSTFNDWSKMIQKVSIPSDKLSESMAKVSQDSIQEVFKIILSLKERNWYEEIAQLYKVLLRNIKKIYCF